MEFTASGAALTRTQLTEGNAVYWEAGDAVSLFDGAAHNNRFTTDESGASVTFRGSADEAAEYFALYPYDAEASFSNGTISTTLPHAQNARAGSFASGLNLSYAEADADNNLSFRNACALVKFTLDGDQAGKVTKAAFSGNGGEVLAGRVSIDLPSGSCQAIDGQGPTAVLLSGQFEAGAAYYFVVVPRTLSSGLTLSLYDSDGKVWKRQSASSAELSAGHILNLGTITPGTFVPESGYELADGVWHVYDADGLAAWAGSDDALSADVVLENDIDLDGKSWTPVGGDMQTGYSGDFDGGGKTIRGLSVDSDAADVGFFGALSEGAKVHDLKFSEAVVNGGSSSYAGVVAGASLGIIEDCTVSGSQVTGNQAGGICGNNSVQVNRCTAVDMKVSGTFRAGGIAGVSYGKIEYCTLSGASEIVADGSSSCAGGIAGSSSEEGQVPTSGRLLKCAVDGATVSGFNAGGIAGENSFGLVAQCVVNEVTVTSTAASGARLGGIVGYNTRGDVVASYSAYSTLGSEGGTVENQGGIVGYNYNGAAYVYGCYSTHVSLLGSVSGDEAAQGCIAGYTSGHVSSCYAVLPDGATGIELVGRHGSYAPDHCVEPGGTDYSVLVEGVADLKAPDGSVWKAAEIWNIAAEGTPAIVSDYLGEAGQ